MYDKKYIRLKTIDYIAKWEYVKGSYYDYVVEVFVTSESQLNMLRMELMSGDWCEIKTSNGVVVFLRDNRVIRIDKIWTTSKDVTT